MKHLQLYVAGLPVMHESHAPICSAPGFECICRCVQVGQVSTPTANVTQALQKTTDTQKLDDVAAVLLEEARQAESSGQQMPLTIIFVERKARCDDVAELLRTEGLSAVALHGGLSQWEREGALRDFTKGDVRVRLQPQQGFKCKHSHHAVSCCVKIRLFCLDVQFVPGQRQLMCGDEGPPAEHNCPCKNIHLLCQSGLQS